MTIIALNPFDAVRLVNMIGPEHASLNPDSPFFAESAEPPYVTSLRANLNGAIGAQQAPVCLRLTPNELDYVLGFMVTDHEIPAGAGIYADPIIVALVDGLRP